MIRLSEFENKSVGVFGLGKAGEATIVPLLASNARVYAWDDNEKGREAIAARYDGKVKIQAIDSWPWVDIEALVLSPGIPLTHPKPHAVVELAKKNHVPVVGDIELLYRAQPKARYVGITGTNGKSTTTTLIGHIIKSANIPVEVGGNLGTPVLSFAPLGENGIYVIETSSYQLDLLKTVRFNVAAFLNVTPDHLDRHGDMQGYIEAKMHIFDHQQDGDSAVIAVDDAYTRDVASRLKKSRVIKVSAQGVSDIYVENGILHDGKITFDLTPIVTLTGRHNWQNAVVAYATCRALGIAPQGIFEAMKSFAGLRHRMQLVATIGGIGFVNDSKATNADATSNALASYDVIYWIAGGKAKAGGIETLGEYFPKIAHAFLIGDAAEEFGKTLEGNAPYAQCGTLNVALEKAAAMAFADNKKGAVVLLSPACASFDQWKNFEERGDAFCSMVEEIAARKIAS